MRYLRRIFGASISMPSTGSRLTPFTITFPNGKTARAVKTSRTADPQTVIIALGLVVPRPALVVTGGAGNMDAQTSAAVRTIVEDGITSFAHENGLTIVDGGTNSGIMALLGAARARRGYTFPLVGVAPEAMVAYPGYQNANKQADMDTNHSHFVFTSGTRWGDESDMLAGVGLAVCGRGAQPVLNLVINGGEIVKTETHARATGALRMPILVLEGSGRFADELANASKHKSGDPLLSAILDKGDVHFLSLSAGAEQMRSWLENFYHL